MNTFIPGGFDSSNGQFEGTLSKWQQDEKVALEFTKVLGELFYGNSVELILLRNQLIDRSASVILDKHSYATNIIKKPLKIEDSLRLAKAILELDIQFARVDIGRLNKEWTEEGQNYADEKAFIKDKLTGFLNGKDPHEGPKDVVLFGFGRIGRLIARQLVIQGNGSQLRLRAIVTRSSDPEAIIKRASLFRNDSVHGRFRGVAIENPEEGTFYVNGHIIQMIEAKNPEDVDYTKYGINNALLIDNTGVFRDYDGLSRHLKANGISKVLLTAPGKGDLPNIVFGVNHDTLNVDEQNIFSAASCTTNAVVPVLHVLEKELGIERGHLETIHSYTNDQNLLDNYHKKYRRGRSAALNMVITETGAAKAAVKAIPNLKDKLTASSVRVPTPNVSLVVLSLTVKRETSKEEVNELLRKAALEGNLVEQIRYSTSNELVSTDCVGDSCTSIVDSPSTNVSHDGRQIIVYVWYDNEFGYIMQVFRLAKHIAKVRRLSYY